MTEPATDRDYLTEAYDLAESGVSVEEIARRLGIGLKLARYYAKQNAGRITFIDGFRIVYPHHEAKPTFRCPEHGRVVKPCYSCQLTTLKRLQEYAGRKPVKLIPPWDEPLAEIVREFRHLQILERLGFVYLGNIRGVDLDWLSVNVYGFTQKLAVKLRSAVSAAEKKT